MALKERLRRALHISGTNGPETTTATMTMTRDSSLSESNSSQEGPTSLARSDSSQPSMPVIMLTKTTSRLSKKLTGRSEKDDEEKERRRKEKEWEAFAPRKYLFLKSSKEREAMTGFEWKWRNSSEGGRASSLYSGISPGTSRRVSMEEESRKSGLGQMVEDRDDTCEGTTTA